MKNYQLRKIRKVKSNEIDIQLNIIQNGRFATILFMIGCFLNFIEYNYSEKAIFQSLSSIDEEYDVLNNEIKASNIAATVSIIFLIAMIIFAINALTSFMLDLSVLDPDKNTNTKISNNQGARLVAFFDLIKVLGYLGAAIGYHIALEELKNSKDWYLYQYIKY